jgi:epoxyqueuosine reductase QueG
MFDAGVLSKRHASGSGKPARSIDDCNLACPLNRARQYLNVTDVELFCSGIL